MSLKKTPTPEDAEVLRFCGILGHRFVTTLSKPDGSRKGWLESNEPPTLADLKREGVDDRDPRTFEQLPKRRWRRVR